MSKIFRFGAMSAVVTALSITSSVALAAPLYVAYDNFNYTGTVTRYSSLADAQGGSNVVSSTAISTATNGTASTLPDARDSQAYVASGAPGYDPANLAYFSTAWYFTTTPLSGNGWGNPNNTNPGFVQYYDGTSAPTVNGGWSNGYKTFTMSVSGGNGDDFNYARLWAAPGGGSQAGKFVSFDLNLSASFASAANLNATTGWYDTNAMPLALVGGAKGIFENDSTSDSSQNGFYAFDFALDEGSWANANGATWMDGATVHTVAAQFAAPGNVPEPGSLGLIALGLVGLVASRRRQAR